MSKQLNLNSGNHSIKKYKYEITALLLGGLISVLSSFLIYEFEEDLEIKEFIIIANDRTAVMEGQLENTLEVIHSILALYSASENVTRAEFSDFASAELSLERNIQAVEWIPRVKLSERSLLEAAARDDGLENYTFKEKS